MNISKIGIILTMGLIIISLGYLSLHIRNQNPIPKNISGKMLITTSFYPLYFFTSQIAGDKAMVEIITPPGIEPHEYEPTARDIARISDSNMLILNGGMFETWGDKIKDQLQGSSTYILVAGDKLINNQKDEAGNMIKDPHIWLDPALAKQEAEKIALSLEKIDSNNASYYRERKTALINDLSEVDREYRIGLENCQIRDFVTSHASFGYLAARYNIHQVAISGISPDEEPSSQKLAEITNVVKSEHIPVIFFETLVSPKLSEVIAAETGAKIAVLDPIEGLSQDKINAGQTYITLMKENLTNLQTALLCSK